MQLLTFASSFLKSRQKLLIKRRNIRIKNRPVSKKYLKEEKDVMNYTFERKLMQIKKGLDKKKSQNHHINQIIQQLFYPDIYPQEASQIETKVKQSTNNLNINEEEFEEYLNQDELSQKIKENLLPIDLLQLHQLNEQHFQLQHYVYLLNKLNYSVKNAKKIQQTLYEKWNKQISKNKDEKTKSKLNRPNFMLLESAEIVRHQLWGNLISGLQVKMKGLVSDISHFNEYIKIALMISKHFHLIPASLYQLIVNTNIAVPFEQLKPTDISRLVNLLRLRYYVKYEPHIKIENPQESLSKESHVHFIRKLATSIITNFQEYKPFDFINIFHVVYAHQKKINILNEQLLNHSEYIFSSIINQLTFQQVQLFLNIYMHNKIEPNLDFVEIVKFDLYRKSQSCVKEVVLLNMMLRIKGRELIYKNNKRRADSMSEIKMEGYHLVLKLAESITKYLNLLEPFQIVKLVDIYYSNDIKQPSLLLSLATEFTRKCISAKSNSKVQNKGKANIGLECVGKSLFKMTLLGYRSRMMSKMVLQEFIQKYHELSKYYRNNQVLLLPTEIKETTMGLNFKEIHLQQCLLMALWAIVSQLSDNQGGFDKKAQEQVLRIIPLRIDSLDPLAIELINNINHQLKPFHLFPKIPIPVYAPHTFPLGRHNELYRHIFSKSQAELLMQQQAALSGNFVQTYNFREGLFLKERWSGIKTYQVQDYMDYCKKQFQASTQKGRCYFNEQISISAQLLNKRKAMLKTNNRQNEDKVKENKQYSKIYDLLL